MNKRVTYSLMLMIDATPMGIKSIHRDDYYAQRMRGVKYKNYYSEKTIHRRLYTSKSELYYREIPTRYDIRYKETEHD